MALRGSGAIRENEGEGLAVTTTASTHASVVGRLAQATTPARRKMGWVPERKAKPERHLLTRGGWQTMSLRAVRPQGRLPAKRPIGERNEVHGHVVPRMPQPSRVPRRRGLMVLRRMTPPPEIGAK
jgi:hypothetical protein